MQKVDINLLNRLIGNKKELYDFLVDQQKIFLPSLYSRAVTSEYLLGILEEKYFTIKMDVCQKHPPLKFTMTAFDIYEELKSAPGIKPLGFDLTCLPDKPWMISVFYQLKPLHRAFAFPEDFTVREVPKK